MIEDLDFLAPLNQKALRYLPRDERVDNETAKFNYYDAVKFLKPKKHIDKNILDFIPTLKARYYSLASDLCDTNKFETLFTVEEHAQENVFEEGHTISKKGVCSNYLDRISEEGKYEFEIKLNKTSMFNTTKEELTSKVPMIFIAHGTAISPLISVLRYFKRLMDHCDIDSLGSIDFYYGIRHKEHDFLYGEELEALLKFFKDANPSAEYNLHVAESKPGKV